MNNKLAALGTTLVVFLTQAVAQGQLVRETAPPPRPELDRDAAVISFESLGAIFISGGRPRQNQNPVTGYCPQAASLTPVIGTKSGGFERGGFPSSHPFSNLLAPRSGGFSGGVIGGAPGLNAIPDSRFGGGSFGGSFETPSTNPARRAGTADALGPPIGPDTPLSDAADGDLVRIQRFGGPHPGGVCGFGDGSARLVRFTVSPATWWNLCRRDDGNVVGDDF